MKRTIIVLAFVAGLGLLLPGTSSADLIGATSYQRNPDLVFNNTGTYSFDAATNTVTIEGTFLQGIFNNADFTTQDGTQSLTISYVVDDSGHYAGGVSGDDVSITGSIDIDQDGIDDFNGTLLTGEVVDAGALAIDTNGGGDFELLLFDGIFNVTGGDLVGTLTLSSGVTTQGFHDLGMFIGLVEQPVGASFGDYGSTSNWSGDKVKVDVASTPEPSSLILLGMGAIGMGGYGWRRRRTRSVV